MLQKKIQKNVVLFDCLILFLPNSSTTAAGELIVGMSGKCGEDVAQLVERRIRDSVTSVTRVRTPSGAQLRKHCEFFRVKNVALTRYRSAQPRVYTHASA